MPTNVSVEYIKAQGKYDNANTSQDKLLALQEMSATVPKHKGTEKLRKEISRKIAKLKMDMEKQKAVATKRGSGPTLNIRKEGAGQIVIIGLPNSGKSTLINSLTGISAEVASYPFTTKKPQVGMMNFKGSLVQLVEVPAIVEGSAEGRALGTQLLSLVRNADGVILTVESDIDKKILLEELHKADIFINKEKPKIEIKQTDFKGITINGKKFLKIKESELVDFLKRFGYHNASILLKEEVTKEKIAQVLNERIEYKKGIFVNPKQTIEIENLKEKIFFLLGKILVFTKKPGQKADYTDPLAVKEGETAETVANSLHKDIAKKFKFARVWGSTKFEGQRVSKDYKLQHEDIIEIN